MEFLTTILMFCGLSNNAGKIETKQACVRTHIRCVARRQSLTGHTDNRIHTIDCLKEKQNGSN